MADTESRESEVPSIEPAGSARERAVVRAYQFTIRDLFLAMTGAAIMAAVASYLGPQTLPFTLGVGLLAAHQRGWFRRAQSGRGPSSFAWLALGLFSMSLFLPAARGCGGKPIRGGELVMIAAELEGQLFTKPLREVEEREKVLREPGKFAATGFYLLCINVANLLLAVSPALPWLTRKWPRVVSPTLVTVSVASVWAFPWKENVAELLPGYWVWFAATLALCLIPRPTWRSLVAPFIVLACLHLMDG